jgi:plasmid maintenance system antidote protein VapI
MSDPVFRAGGSTFSPDVLRRQLAVLGEIRAGSTPPPVLVFDGSLEEFQAQLRAQGVPTVPGPPDRASGGPGARSGAPGPWSLPPPGALLGREHGGRVYIGTGRALRRLLDEADPARPFEPDWASPPGDTIRTILRDRGLATGSLCESLALTPEAVDDLLAGRTPIDPALAEKLAACLGSTPGFWRRRDAQYRAACAPLRRTPGVL